MLRVQRRANYCQTYVEFLDWVVGLRSLWEHAETKGEKPKGQKPKTMLLADLTDAFRVTCQFAPSCLGLSFFRVFLQISSRHKS